MPLFKRNTQSYGTTPELVSAYQKAGQAWDERIGSARVQARNWRLMAFLCLGLMATVGMISIWQSLQSKIIPYVVEVDRLGAVRKVGMAEKPYSPGDAQIAYSLSAFIKNTRSISIDPIILRENWERAYAYVTDRAAASLTEYARTHDPFKEIGKRSVTVEITSVVRASDSSFQIKWTEQYYRSGMLHNTDHYTAILSIILQQPRDVEQLRRNPLGIYVHGLNWSRDVKLGEDQ